MCVCVIGGRDEDYGYFFSKQGTSFQENYSTTGGGCWIHVGSKLVLAVDGDEQVEAYRAKYLFLDCDCIFSGWKMYLYSLSSLRFVSKVFKFQLFSLSSFFKYCCFHPNNSVFIDLQFHHLLVWFQNNSDSRSSSFVCLDVI